MWDMYIIHKNSRLNQRNLKQFIRSRSLGFFPTLSSRPVREAQASTVTRPPPLRLSRWRGSSTSTSSTRTSTMSRPRRRRRSFLREEFNARVQGSLALGIRAYASFLKLLECTGLLLAPVEGRGIFCLSREKKQTMLFICSVVNF